MVSDPIADMLARIKNAYLARQPAVEIPYAKIKEEIGKILVKEKYLKNQKTENLKNQKTKKIVCELKYQEGKPALSDFVRVSKPGRRVYAGWKKIPRTLSGYGITIVSTPEGVMTDNQARKKKLGGEVICKIY